VILQHFNILSSCVLPVSFLTVKKSHALPHSLHSKARFQNSVQHFTSIFFHAVFKLCMTIMSGTLEYFSQSWPGKATLRSIPFSGDDRTGSRRTMEGVYSEHLVHVPTREHELVASTESAADWHLAIFFIGLQIYYCIASAGNLVQKFTAILFLLILGFPNNLPS